MSESPLEKIDVFLPGVGDKLAQAPAYRWKPLPKAIGRIYESADDPNRLLVHIDGLSKREVHHLAERPVEIDRSGVKCHEFVGFGLHLPGLLVSSHGTAIAICQKRHHSMADSGNRIDILVSRSEDGGRTWEPQKVIFEEEGTSAILGSIFEDTASGTELISFWKMPDDVTDDLGYFSTHAETGAKFWLLKSTDEGRTWSEPVQVVAQPNAEGWVGWPNNYVHGIQLTAGLHSGRLVIPAFLYKEGEAGQVPGVRGGLLYSDSGGEDWIVGAVLPEGSDEVSLVETGADIYVSYRKNSLRTGKRHFARSSDGGESFSEHGEHDDVPCRNLHAGLTRCQSPDGERLLLFSHPPAGSPATDMTIRLGRDDGRTWAESRIIDPGPCRYSDLAVALDGTILCLYTNGVAGDRDKISVMPFSLDGLLA